MRPEVVNKNKNCVFIGPYAGRDLYITMYQDSEREFVVTHNANIKPVAYFTGRGTELQDLQQRVEEGRKSVLVSGMGGIGKTHICRKLFEEYLNKHAEDGKCPFRHIGYIEYSGDMGISLQNCLKFKRQEKPEQNQEAAWKELEYLASDGKFLLFVDNVDRPIGEDAGLQRLKGLPGAVVLTSRQASFSDEFEPYRIGFLGMEQCKEIYEKIRFRGSGKKVDLEEVGDLEYIIENLAGRHTITVELLGHLAWTKSWSVKRLREELEQKSFRLTFHKGGELVNIQKSYEKLYDLSELTEAEQNILEAFSVFPYIPLKAETCNKWLLADAGFSEEDDILMVLYQKGWLQFDVEQEGYALHPAFAQFIYEKCRPSLEWHRRLFKECQAKLKQIEWGIFLGIGEEFVLFAESMAEKLDMEKSEEQITFLELIGNLLCKMSNYEGAKRLFLKRVEICEEIYGKPHLNTAKSYSDLAYVCECRGEDKETEELSEKSLRILEKFLGRENPCIIEDYYRLANMKIMQGKYGEAEALLVKVILGWEKYVVDRELYGHYVERNGIDISDVYESLVYVNVKQGEDEKAQKWFESEWQSIESVMGTKYPDVAINYSVMSSIYCLKEEYEVALTYALKAYKIFINEVGINDIATKANHDIVENVYRQLHPEENFGHWLEDKLNESV